jgi:aryl-alcohol dehydrogenase-like predicted oxidoreductase
VIPRVPLAPGYSIPRLIVGGWQLAQGHSTSPADTRAIHSVWDRLVDLGADTFDCADIYPGVERLLGAYSSARRARGLAPIQVHTKLVPDRSALRSISRRYVESVVDRSLSRLGLERLDLVQFHWWDYAVPRYLETFRWLDLLRAAGKIRHLGLTNFDRLRFRELAASGVEIASAQVQYSVVDGRPARGLAAECAARGTSLLCYGTLAGGFVTDRWLGAPAPTGPLENRSLVKYKLVIDDVGGWPALQRMLEVLARIARRHGATIADIAIRSVLERPAVGAAIVGIRDGRHLDRLARVFDFTVDSGDQAEIDAVLGPDAGPPGDVYEVERVPGGIHAGVMRYEVNREAPEGTPAG